MRDKILSVVFNSASKITLDTTQGIRKLFLLKLTNVTSFSSPSHWNFGNCTNFRLSVFGGFARFGIWRIQKTQN